MAQAIKSIKKGQELINSYGKFYDHVLFSQYGFVPTDGSGTSIASLFVYHDIDLMGELVGEARPSLPSLEKMSLYLQQDYGYEKCITKKDHPDASDLKLLKLWYLQQISIDSSRWVLPLPPRSSTQATPVSTTKLPKNYKVPTFDDSVYDYLQANALGLSLPCRLITLTETDLDNAAELLKEDLRTLKLSDSPQQTPMLKLEELEVSFGWMGRTIHCIKSLAMAQTQKYTLTSVDQESYIMSLVEAGNINTLEWNAAHVKLEEMQSQEALENFATGFFNSIAEMEGTSNEFYTRDKPCPLEYTTELIPY